jgi:hypothetical protein
MAAVPQHPLKGRDPRRHQYYRPREEKSWKLAIFGSRAPQHFVRKALWTARIVWGHPLSRAPIGTGPPPFAPPWPIYPSSIFSGSGVLASKRGGRGGNLDAQIDGQIMRVQKLAFPKKIGKSEGNFKIQSFLFWNPISKISFDFFDPII